MSDPIETQYDPKAVEAKLYAMWESKGVFQADARSPKTKYTIVFPPPNVTGVLHMGHALTVTIEDMLIRWKRMQGAEALWIPGTDHAGIATQMVVERRILKDDNTTRHQLGREKFLEKVWEWKNLSQTTILNQMRLLGSSVDWSRLKFTLDPDVSIAVRECFYRLYQDGLIYRELAMTQWCPRCQTALSDLEVKAQELNGKLWEINYPIEGDSTSFLTVATTRPETMLGDVAVAVHPDDVRYHALKGKNVILPLLNRAIPVIEDTYVDPAFGTGVVKITPAHDPNDYEIGKRHQLPILDIMDSEARLNAKAGVYQGLKRELARKKVLEDLSAQGLLVSEKNHKHNVGHCDRCSTVVEPKLSRQWFVKAEVLAKPAIEAVQKGEIKIIPAEWEKTYFEWMLNIRPWCISRQLWWGHRIPVWYCPEGHETVSVADPDQCSRCSAKTLTQDEDVLDTWFSSGLWPFSTLGWPKLTDDLKAFYPTDVLETGFDILFFWVARMIMLGIRMTGKIPFHTVYLHPMVRDESGHKMSKTKGNVVDPLEIVKTTGADSLRFFFANHCFHGRDVRVSDAQIQASRNFMNKIWNASRFVQMHFGHVKESNIDFDNEVNVWIWSALNETKKEVKLALEQYRFFDVAQLLYHFLWDTYCFWFIEYIKAPEELERRKAAKESTAVEVLEEILRLAHPIIPFITEAIWQRLNLKVQASCLATAAYPQWDESRFNAAIFKRMESVGHVVDEIRRIRGVHNIGPAIKLTAIIVSPPDSDLRAALIRNQSVVMNVARLDKMELVAEVKDLKGYVAGLVGELKVLIPKDALGVTGEQVAQWKVALQAKEAAHARAEAKLSNASFVGSAPPAVVDGVRAQRDALIADMNALKDLLKDES